MSETVTVWNENLSRLKFRGQRVFFFSVLLVPVKAVFICPEAEGAAVHLFVLSGVDTLGYNYQRYLENCQHLSLRTEAIKRSYRSTTRYVRFNEGFLVALQFGKFYDLYLFTFLKAIKNIYLSLIAESTIKIFNLVCRRYLQPLWAVKILQFNLTCVTLKCLNQSCCFLYNTDLTLA